ncbi:MAG TPA: pilus assembly protein PilM [Vicinamibacterales bacterium]|jgi:type IV pilus assembly protein PilM|nr:pilus assembly protein PilM [Vicinamibacterales bacterium]
MSPLPRFLISPPPAVGVEIASDRVTAVSIARQGAGWIVGAHGTERLPAGLVTPALNATNVHDARALAAAVRSAFDKLGARPRRVGLVIPDTAAKVSLLRFEKVPGASDLDQLIRWQVRKAAPFKPEDAQVSWIPGAPMPGGGREYVVTLGRRDIVESYMRACVEAGAEAGIVDLASLNLINAALASGSERGDALIVHVAPDYATLAIVRDKQLIFFRTRQLEPDADLADLVHQTAMYHEDRLSGATFARVVLSGASARGTDAGDRLRRTLEERMGVRVEPLDFRGTASMRDRIAAGPDLLDALAPALGVVLRERVA